MFVVGALALSWQASDKQCRRVTTDIAAPPAIAMQMGALWAYAAVQRGDSSARSLENEDSRARACRAARRRPGEIGTLLPRRAGVPPRAGDGPEHHVLLRPHPS